MTKSATPITAISDSRKADLEGVRRFTLAMQRKLAYKRRQGRYGWNTTVASGWGCSVANLQRMLLQHIKKGDPVDLANFCMMIWNRKHPRGLKP